MFRRYDNRRRDGGGGTHWRDESALGTDGRAELLASRRRLLLRLATARPEDAAHYRCRVDFVKARTKTAAVNLEVIGEMREA